MKLTVNSWLKVFMASMCLAPAVLIIWALHNQAKNAIDHSNFLIMIGIGSLPVIALIGMAIRLYALCSVELSDEDVTQRFLLNKGRFLVVSRIKWNEMQSVSFKGSSYYFSNGTESVEVNTTLFNRHELVMQFVRAHLPERLLALLHSTRRAH